MYAKKPEVIENAPESFFDIAAETLKGELVQFSKFRGKAKAILVVNVASACQLANANYKQLVALYEKYREAGLEILCFPCNQFYNREPGCNADIEQYLREHFQPEFLVFSKTDCNGAGAHPVYKYLRKHTAEFRDRSSTSSLQDMYKPIPLTFAKFLLDGSGKVVSFYEPIVYPNAIKPDIERLLL